MATRHAAQLAALLERIARFRRSELSLDALKSAIWETARAISSHDERALRDALQDAEGRLDLAQFTVDGADLRLEALKIVDAVEARLRAAMP